MNGDTRELVKEAAREAVREMLSTYGFGNDPQSSQADMAYLRAQRLLSDRLGTGLRFAIIGALVSGALAALWLGIRVMLKSGS